MSKVSTNINLDADLKRSCQELFADLGMDLTTAVTIFLKQSLRVQGLPFAVTRDVPNAETVAALEEYSQMKKIAKLNPDNSMRDVNENARIFVADWIASNRKSFTDDSRERYGFTEVGIVYVFPTILNRALTEAGYNPRKTLKYFADKHIIERDSQGKTSVVKWFLDSSMRFVKINTDLLNKSENFDEFVKMENTQF